MLVDRKIAVLTLVLALGTASALGQDGAALAWASRPAEAVDVELVGVDPAIRVHVARSAEPDLADRNADGIPDEAAVVLATASRVLRHCERSGLGTPHDDGDGELDVYLLAADGQPSAEARLEAAVPPGLGARGFVEIRIHPRLDDQDVSGLVARAIGRLVLARHDARAPLWWAEASAAWIQGRVAGPSFDLRRAVQARWNHPEIGYRTDDPLLALGNVGLLWSLEDATLERRVVRETWTALAERDAAETALEVIDRSLTATSGLSLLDLQRRAAIVHLVSGVEPDRFALTIGQLPALATRPLLPIARGGLALILVEPDPRHPEGTALELDAIASGWRWTLLAHRRESGWDLVEPRRRTARGALKLAIPWNDYDRGVLLLERAASQIEPELPRISGLSAGSMAPFALSALSARRRGDGHVEVSWTSAWESGLFGWVVEQSASPEGPWRRIQDLPIPSIGLPTEGTAYSVLERRRPGAFPSYYRVVGVTLDGLAVSGPVVAAGGL